METPPADLASLTLDEFNNRLASAEPVPGGGSASALAGSIAASLLAMVSRLSLGRPKYAAYQPTNERALSAAEDARHLLLALADEDMAAFGRFAAARKMPRDTPAQEESRAAATRAAARAASDTPMKVIRACQSLLLEIEASAGRSNVNAASDLEVAGRLAGAAAWGAAANVKINLPMVGDEAYAGATTAELEGIVSDMSRTLAKVVERVGAGELRPPERG